MAALRRLQRQSGMLSQLLNFAGYCQELTAVCMVGCAVARVDGCTGAGAGDSRRFYLARAAEFGQDDRAGNLALWFAVEMERLRRG